MIDYNKHRMAIEQMYEDLATISRYTKKKDLVSKEEKQVLEPVYKDQSCKLSKSGLPKNGQTEDANIIQYDTILFIAPDLEIKQGDVIAVTRKAMGRVESYTAGEPFPPYQSHQEVSLTRADWA